MPTQQITADVRLNDDPIIYRQVILRLPIPSSSGLPRVGEKVKVISQLSTPNPSILDILIQQTPITEVYLTVKAIDGAIIQLKHESKKASNH